MKKTVTFLSAALLVVCINAQVEPTDTDSDGARNVSTLDHLRWISENSNSWSSSFELDNDIDAATTSSWNYYTDIVGFKPIGLGFLSNFEGTFDGKGFTISNLYISSSVTGLPVGMFSTTDNATIQGLTISNGNVSSDNTGAAILIGKSNNTIVNNCSVSGTTNGTSKVGGLIGSAITTTVNSCFADINIPSINNYIGGLVGELKSGSVISNSNSTGTITGNDDVGGLVGNSNGSQINNSFSSANISSDKQNVGGFIGMNYQSTIEESYSLGSVTLIGQASTKSGGFVGYNNLGTISLCYSLGSVSSEDSEVGGFVGYNDGTIEKSYAYVNTIGRGTVGGFVGENISSGTISNCYSRGTVTATGTGHVYLGGFVGSNTIQGEIINSYATGYVSAPNTTFTDLGGFVGDNDNSAPQAYRGIVTNCYWDNNTSGMSSSDAGSGESTSNMKTQSTFNNWNFTNVWTISPAYNNGYPYLGLYTVNVKEKQKTAMFSVFPNPVRNQINISIEEGIVNKVKIIDLTGKTVLQINGFQASTIDISALNNGIYLIQVNDYKLTKKIIKQ